MKLLNRMNGKEAKCVHCGRTLLRGTGHAVKIDGNTVACICPDCIEGKMKLGFAFRPKTTGNGRKRGSCVTTKEHTVKAVITNPFTALDFTICHGAELVKIEDNGDMVIEIANQVSCDKVGHVFSEDHLADNFKMVFVNGQPVENIDDYHKVVKVWG